MVGTPNRQLEAFRRLLANAAEGGQAKTDALVALCQRTVLAPTWGAAPGAYRTLVNSGGITALPIFTGTEDLTEASHRFGWGTPDGRTPPSNEIGAREALRYAAANDIKLVVVDIASSHALEVEQSEITPILTAKTRPERKEIFPAFGTGTQQAIRALASAGTTVDPPAGPLSDPILSSLAQVLRGYPEVEWAAHCQVSRGGADLAPCIAVRIDGTFKTRLHEIAASVETVLRTNALPHELMMLDDPDLTRTIRARGVAFYPWRRK